MTSIYAALIMLASAADLAVLSTKMIGGRGAPLCDQSRPEILVGICLFAFIETVVLGSLASFFFAGALWPQRWSDAVFIAILLVTHLVFAVPCVIGIVQSLRELQRRRAAT